MSVKLKRDDTVLIIAGKDRGKTGKVLRIDEKKGKIIDCWKFIGEIDRGGEFLETLRPFPENVCATEGHPPT